MGSQARKSLRQTLLRTWADWSFRFFRLWPAPGFPPEGGPSAFLKSLGFPRQAPLEDLAPCPGPGASSMCPVPYPRGVTVPWNPSASPARTWMGCPDRDQETSRLSSAPRLRRGRTGLRAEEKTWARVGGRAARPRAPWRLERGGQPLDIQRVTRSGSAQDLRKSFSAGGL